MNCPDGPPGDELVAAPGTAGGPCMCPLEKGRKRCELESDLSFCPDSLVGTEYGHQGYLRCPPHAGPAPPLGHRPPAIPIPVAFMSPEPSRHLYLLGGFMPAVNSASAAAVANLRLGPRGPQWGAGKGLEGLWR